jgi:hypothetical protein
MFLVPLIHFPKAYILNFAGLRKLFGYRHTCLCVMCPVLCVCVVLCAVFYLSVMCYFVWYVYFCVLCLIVVPLPPGKTPFTVK